MFSFLTDIFTPTYITIQQVNHHDDSIIQQKQVRKSNQTLDILVKEIFVMDMKSNLQYTDENGVFISGSTLWSDLPSIIKFKCYSDLQFRVDGLLNKYMKVESGIKPNAKIYDYQLEDSFKITRRIHKSSNSIVYMISKNSETFILKIVDFVDNSNERIVNSITNGENIVKMYGLYEYECSGDTYHFYILECCAFGSLYSVLHEMQLEVSPQFILDAFIQIYKGLNIIWKYKYIHRDIKLSNIGVCELSIENNVLIWAKLKLMDFGSVNHELTPTTSSSLKNNKTDGYTCPDINETFSVKSDLYALGITLWKAYCKPLEDITKINDEKLYNEKLHSYLNNMDQTLCDLLAKLLSYKKDDRDLSTLLTFNEDTFEYIYSSSKETSEENSHNEIADETDIVIDNNYVNLSNREKIKYTFMVLGHISIPSNRQVSSISNHSFISYLYNSKIIGENERNILFGLFNVTKLIIPFYSEIGDEGCAILSCLTNLRELTIGKTHIGQRGILEISNLTNLTVLDISYNDLGYEEFTTFTKLSKLTKLNITQCNLSAEAADVISSLTNLTYLKMSDNNIRDSSYKLSNLINLHTLWVSGCVSDNGVNTWNALTNLTYLFCASSSLGYKGAESISSILNLETLHINDNHIGQKGALLLTNLKKLRYLDLQDNSISDKKKIQEEFSYCKTLYI